MKKVIILMLTILLICTNALFALDNPARTDVLWNGYGWKKFEKDEKFAYNYKWIFILGLNDGSVSTAAKAVT